MPSDPIMLLSYINTKLRDNYDSLEVLCNEMDADKNDIISKLKTVGYEYSVELNKFI